MYCKNCGAEIVEGASFCFNCGSPVEFDVVNKSEEEPDVVYNLEEEPKDSLNTIFTLLGFLMPLIGLILFIVYENKNPQRAKSAGKGALIGFITGVVLAILIPLIIFVISGLIKHNFF